MNPFSNVKNSTKKDCVNRYFFKPAPFYTNIFESASGIQLFHVMYLFSVPHLLYIMPTYNVLMFCLMLSSYM